MCFLHIFNKFFALHHLIRWIIYTSVGWNHRYTCTLKSNSWIFVSFKTPLDKGILEYKAVNNNAFFIYVHNFIWLKDSGALLQHLQSWDIISLSSRAQTTNYHRFDWQLRWEQLKKFQVKTYFNISPLLGLVSDMSEASTKSRWSTYFRQYEVVRIIFTTDSCLFEKTSNTKITLISLSNCCRWDRACIRASSLCITRKVIRRLHGGTY